jgi:hypothetical protein
MIHRLRALLRRRRTRPGPAADSRRSHHCEYGETRAFRYLLSRLCGNEDALECLRAEMGSCAKCWASVADSLAVTLANCVSSSDLAPPIGTDFGPHPFQLACLRGVVDLLVRRR